MFNLSGIQKFQLSRQELFPGRARERRQAGGVLDINDVVDSIHIALRQCMDGAYLSC